MGTMTDVFKRANPRADFTEMNKALEAANCQFILDMENGINSLIGYTDRGIELSLSQRKRLGLARALVARPKLLLIDDCDEGLDPEGTR